MRAGRATATSRSPPDPIMRIEVTRPFCIDGNRKEAGEQFDVDKRFGRELIHNGKAREVVEAPAAEVVAEAPVAPRRKKAEAA